MEGELRRFGKRAQKDEDDNRHVKIAALNEASHLVKRGDFGCAGDADQQHQPDHHSKTARARQKPRPTPDSSTVEGTRLYVGNLSYDASEHDLEDLLKGVGSVRNIDIVYNRNTHRSSTQIFYCFITA